MINRPVQSAAFVLALFAASPAHADAPSPLDRAAAAAQILRVDALEVRQLLGDRDVNLVAVLQRVEVLRMRADALRDGVAGLRAAPEPGRTVETTRTLGEVDLIAQTLAALIDRKVALLVDLDEAATRRRQLRDKADGVHKRAALIDERIGRLLDQSSPTIQ